MAIISPGPLKLPPKRPDVRDALLQAASELIIERDTLEVALTDVAQRASVNSALIQYYFGNKDGFLLALLNRDIGDAVRRMRILLVSEATATDKLTAHLSGIARAYHRAPYLNRLLRMISNAADEDAFEELVHKLIDPMCSFYRDVIAQGVAAGDLREVDPVLLYFTVVGACDQLFSNRRLFNRLAAEGRTTDAALGVFTDYLVTLVFEGIRLQP